MTSATTLFDKVWSEHVVVPEPADTHDGLLDNPGIEVTVDIEQETLALPDGKVVACPIDGFARYCLVEGVDQPGFLPQKSDATQHFEETRSWKP